MIRFFKDGRYPLWFRLLNGAVCVLTFWGLVVLLVLGIEYELIVGNW